MVTVTPYDDLSSYTERLLGRDITWKRHALCRGHDLAKQKCFACDERDTVILAGTPVKGLEAQKAAAGVCLVCPVQWECALHGLEDIELDGVDGVVGVWAMIKRDLVWLSKRDDGVTIINEARIAKEPVQVAVRKARKSTV